jgi:hypothetical protein
MLIIAIILIIIGFFKLMQCKNIEHCRIDKKDMDMLKDIISEDTIKMLALGFIVTDALLEIFSGAYIIYGI